LATVPQYDEVDIGEEAPVRCLRDGIWLVEQDNQRFAVLLVPPDRFDCFDTAQRMRLQIAVPPAGGPIALVERFFSRIERGVQAARSYRGKILSLELAADYTGRCKGIKVHQLNAVERSQLVLPELTLELLDRNVIGFVQRRHELARLGMAVKKGLL